MKTILFLTLTLLTSIASHANEVSNIYELPGKNQSQIFNAAKEWVVLNFKSANDVIQSADKDSGTIIAKGNTVYKCSGVGDCLLNLADSTLEFTLKIDTKDEKARITFSQFDLYRYGISDRKRTNGVIGKKQEENIQLQMKSLSDQIVEKINTTQSSNW